MQITMHLSVFFVSASLIKLPTFSWSPWFLYCELYSLVVVRFKVEDDFARPHRLVLGHNF